MSISLKATTLLLAGALAGVLGSGTVAEAQLYNPCPYTNDGDCDEPNGLGYCAWGTDTADCSNPNSNFGGGTGYGSTTAGGGATGGGGLMNPCPYTNDGDCDEPNGLGYCAWGTDTADCSNPNANYGSGSGYSGSGGSGSTAGTGGGALVTFSPWRSITNDQRQYAAQPGGAYPLIIHAGTAFQAGNYVIYHGRMEHEFAPIEQIQSYPVTLVSNTRYLASATSAGTVAFNTDARLLSYSEPGPGRAMIYARNDDPRYYRAICVLPAGWPMSRCSAN